jgi:hypothetical protein
MRKRYVQALDLIRGLVTVRVKTSSIQALLQLTIFGKITKCHHRC